MLADDDNSTNPEHCTMFMWVFFALAAEVVFEVEMRLPLEIVVV